MKLKNGNEVAVAVPVKSKVFFLFIEELRDKRGHQNRARDILRHAKVDPGTMCIIDRESKLFRQAMESYDDKLTDQEFQAELLRVGGAS